MLRPSTRAPYLKAPPCWTAPTNATLETITSYDLRYIRSDASNKADGNWTVVSAIWTSGPLAYTLNPCRS